MGPQKYRKKPVVIEAVRWLGPAPEAVQALQEWGVPVEPGGPKPEDAWDAPLWPLFIQTLEGRMRCNLGDWVICGVRGEFYPCAPDVFEVTYEPVGEGA